MILVVANVYLKEGRQEKFLVNAKECIAKTLQEEGNISYNLNKSIDDDCKFTFVEQWESNEALELHMQTPHFGAFGDSVKDILSKELEINVFHATKLN